MADAHDRVVPTEPRPGEGLIEGDHGAALGAQRVEHVEQNGPREDWRGATPCASRVVSTACSQHGEKFVVDGGLPAQAGQDFGRIVRTVWIVDSGGDVPRLVTAYPARV